MSHNTVPKALISQATVVDMPNVRAWGDTYSPVLQRSLVESIHQARAIDPRGVVDTTGHVNVLALSGGGANGAFGAGLLNGWTAAGTRPVFKLVTGISTGALIAPFAFLGSDYDSTLRDFYTTISTKDIYNERSYLAILFDPSSMVDTTPLQTILAKQVNEQVLAEVAQAHQRGRRLFIGTTNMEAGKLVIWDMGAIATSGKPGALELFRKVMLASASIPVAFPAVYIPVVADGKRYEEMHVDGGTATQVFFYGFTLDLHAAAQEAGIQGRTPVRLYVVRNGKLTVPWQLMLPSILPIAERSLQWSPRRSGRWGLIPHLHHRSAGWHRVQPGTHPRGLRHRCQRVIRSRGDEPPLPAGLRMGASRIPLAAPAPRVARMSRHRITGRNIFV